MPRFVGVVLIALMIFLSLGMLIPSIVRQRGLSDRVVSQDHLRRIGFAIAHASLPGLPPPLNAAEEFHHPTQPLFRREIGNDGASGVNLGCVEGRR